MIATIEYGVVRAANEGEFPRALSLFSPPPITTRVSNLKGQTAGGLQFALSCPLDTQSPSLTREHRNISEPCSRLSGGCPYCESVSRCYEMVPRSSVHIQVSASRASSPSIGDAASEETPLAPRATSPSSQLTDAS